MTRFQDIHTNISSIAEATTNQDTRRHTKEALEFAETHDATNIHFKKALELLASGMCYNNQNPENMLLVLAKVGASYEEEGKAGAPKVSYRNGQYEVAVAPDASGNGKAIYNLGLA